MANSANPDQLEILVFVYYDSVVNNRPKNFKQQYLSFFLDQFLSNLHHRYFLAKIMHLNFSTKNLSRMLIYPQYISVQKKKKKKKKKINK